LAFDTDDPLEDNENKFCSLWTTFHPIDDCANLFLNENLRGDYFFNRLNNIQFCRKIDNTLNKALEICWENMQDLYVHIPYDSYSHYLTELLIRRGFKKLDMMYVLRLANHTHNSRDRRWNGHSINIEVQKDPDLWVRVFCDSFSVRAWERVVDEIIRHNKRTLDLFVARIPGKTFRPVGCMLLYRFHDVTGLYCLGTVKQFRLKGIATKMIEFAASYVGNMETKNLIVHSLSTETTINLYRSLGFEIVRVKGIFVSRFLN